MSLAVFYLEGKHCKTEEIRTLTIYANSLNDAISQLFDLGYNFIRNVGYPFLGSGKCCYCGRELTTGDIDGICSLCRSYSFSSPLVIPDKKERENSKEMELTLVLDPLVEFGYPYTVRIDGISYTFVCDTMRIEENTIIDIRYHKSYDAYKVKVIKLLGVGVSKGRIEFEVKVEIIEDYRLTFPFYAVYKEERSNEFLMLGTVKSVDAGKSLLNLNGRYGQVNKVEQNSMAEVIEYAKSRYNR